MSPKMFDSARFCPSGYDLNNPLDCAKFQHTVEEFMGSVRDNTFRYPTDQKLLDEFCGFVNNKEVWCLAQTMVPEFRLAREDQ